MATTNFFEQLEDFLPSHVSPLPSYLYAFVAFVVAGLLTYYLGAGYLVHDFNRDERVTETEERARKYVQVAASAIISLVAADAAYDLSFMIRGYKANKKHFVYRRWFPKFYRT
jgi:hypothetical protein